MNYGPPPKKESPFSRAPRSSESFGDTNRLAVVISDESSVISKWDDDLNLQL